MIEYLIIFFLLVLTLYLIFWLFCLLYAQIFGAPTVYTSNKAVFDALKLSGIKKGELLVDLGCGDARVLITAAKNYGARGIGIERSPFCFLKSKWKVFLSHQTGNIKIYFGNFQNYEEKLVGADVVFVYLLNTVNKKIEKWLFHNISKKAKVVSLSFEFPKHEPFKTVSTKTLGRETKIYLYKK